MDVKHVVVLAFQVSILCTVFGLGLKTTSEDLQYLLRRPGLLVRSLAAVLVIMPVVAVVLARLFDFRSTVEIALIALAISPVPPMLPRKEAAAGGQRAYALGLLALLSLLSIVSVPLSVELLERYFGQSFAMAPGPIAKVVLVAVLLPLILGVAVRAVTPAIADRIEQPLRWVPTVLIPVAALGLLAGSWRALWGALGEGTVVEMVVFVAVGLAVGHLLGGPRADHAVVLALSTAFRHPAIALSTAAANFPDVRFGGTILLYLIVSTAVSIPYVAWQRRRVSQTASTESRTRRAA
jgi:bile acid:Na+ symporter, BASS family